MESYCCHMDLFRKRVPTLVIQLSCHCHLRNLTNAIRRSWKLWGSMNCCRMYLVDLFLWFLYMHVIDLFHLLLYSLVIELLLNPSIIYVFAFWGNYWKYLIIVGWSNRFFQAVLGLAPSVPGGAFIFFFCHSLLTTENSWYSAVILFSLPVSVDSFSVVLLSLLQSTKDMFIKY